MGLFDHPYFGPLDPQVDSSIAQLVSRGGSGGGGSGGGGNAPGCAWLVDEQGQPVTLESYLEERFGDDRPSGGLPDA